MWSPRETELITRYSNEISQIYERSSRVPILTTPRLEHNAAAEDFIKIGKRFLIPREFFEPNHYIVMKPFSNFIELSEFQYLIDTLLQIKENRIRCQEEPSSEIINSAITNIITETCPNFMIVPVSFFVHMHTQNRSRLIDYREDSREYYNGYGMAPLRIIWSNKYVRLNQIIIGNSNDSIWMYKGGNFGRLLIEFENTGLDLSMLIQTVFRYIPPPSNNLSVIDFPEELCRL
jgi:hypothetical protein